MGNKLYEESSVQAIANAIRSKLGTLETYTIGEMADAVSSISGGGTGTLDINENGTYNVGDYDNVDVNVEQYGKPVVPQTGTWQYKSTYPCGFIIIGKDDDTADSAMFVRMVNGYGFPVTLNSTQQCQLQRCNSDSDTQYSTYPEGCGGPFFPDGCTINELNKFVIKYGLGEIAMHGVSAEKIWNSDLLTGTVLDNYYDTYITGGGTRTKEEFKEIIIDKYSDTDAAQGAPIVARKRKLLQAALDNWVYTIGTWGGSFNIVVDDINCGNSGPLNYTTQPFSRSQNWMGDGQLSNDLLHSGISPYHIYRDSAGLFANKIEEDLDLAYNNRCCVDLFHHYYLDGSEDKWNNFKTTMDTIQSYNDQGKIYVVTRKQYYELGEFVEHPIVTLSVTTKDIVYSINKVFTSNDFNIKAVLDNGTEVDCEDDYILDLSGIDSSIAGIYEVTLEYRGFIRKGSVVVSNELPTNFILENFSASGQGINSRDNIAPLNSSISYEAGKTYRTQFHFKSYTTYTGGQHYYEFWAPGMGGNIGWRTSTSFKIDAVRGITEGDVIYDTECTSNASIDYLTRIKAILNVADTGWEITNGYIYEIRGGE